ncbi:hypothetical protein [Xinfangfangia pollutisoli]|uniref:hypothetical protein n=1 Tax=Xinfangfangia pollutisoli TaxID=2865960 RepID=UPI001CD5A9D4|nr:hypothetical protein [Xinfangfangia pollutisoli]
MHPIPFRRTRLVLPALALGTALSLAGAAAAAPQANDYPTEARAEYVFACMAVNGQSQDALRRCSCSIDEIASILPFDDYVSAETVLRMRQGGGEAGAMFRGAPAMRNMLADLRRAQAEAEMLCF